MYVTLHNPGVSIQTSSKLRGDHENFRDCDLPAVSERGYCAMTTHNTRNADIDVRQTT
jgi:hypothetical protein